MKTVNECVDAGSCYSCSACVNSCPANCIKMMPTGPVGSLFPLVDAEKCLRCGKCLQVCPTLHDSLRRGSMSVLAACSKSKDLCSRSTSGGIATEISREVINAGGVVYGSAMIGSEARHIRVASIADLDKLQGSKYVFSRLYNSFRQVKADMANGTPTLFIGVPCQVAGLVRYLPKISDNLLLVDLLCHGAPSQDCLKSGIKLETSKPISSVAFRDGSKYCLRGFEAGGGTIFETPYRASYWLNGFVEGYIFRECCYSCKFAGRKRYGDITVGDFWGYKGSLDAESGVSFVSINSDKGAAAWNAIRVRVNYEQRMLDEEIPFNHSLTAPALKPKNYKRYKWLYQKFGGTKALLVAYINKTAFIWLRRAIRSNRRVYRVVKRIPIIGKKLAEYPT